jgi:hypothetical protein
MSISNYRNNALRTPGGNLTPRQVKKKYAMIVVTAEAATDFHLPTPIPQNKRDNDRNVTITNPMISNRNA